MSAYNSASHAMGGYTGKVKIPKLRSKDIERFAWFEPWLARGGQPSTGALEDLKAQGIRIIVNLRMRDETNKVQDAGFEGLHIPVRNDHAPTESQALRWLTICEQNYESKPIFVHCKGGEGRTSAFCALVRLAQGYNVDDAIREETQYDFQPDGKHHAQAQFLREFAQRAQSGSLVLPALPRLMERAER